MTALEILQESLKKAPVAETQFPHSHFDEIVGFIEQEELDQASKLIEKLLDKGVLDIRLIVYYFYAHFFNGGVKSFIEIFPQAISIINEHWTALLPLNKKEKQIQNSFNWFFLNVISKLKFCEKLSKTGQIHPIWSKSTAELSQHELDTCLESLESFKKFYQEKWPKSPIQERMMHLMKIVEDLRVQIPPKEEPQKIEEELILETPAEEVQTEEPKVEEEVPEQPSPPIYGEKMATISAKLHIFELLIKKKDFAKAALVANDIDLLIENFDPLIYFPKLFATYFSLMAKNVDVLSEQWQNPESPQLKHLKNLYNADPEMFIKW